MASMPTTTSLTDPRYPIGPFQRPAETSPALRASHIATLRARMGW
ncbi:MAG TPA: hypothetical protein VFU55_03055 [Terracidiphilus sp.]|nr:hypothetical protein [Terracidiphilus sp.]